MELKQDTFLGVVPNSQCFNRTFMELKLSFKPFNILILMF